MNLRELFFSKDYIEVKPVEIKGETYYVRPLTGPERSKLELALAKLKKTNNESEANTWIVLLSTCDDKGNRIFQDEDFDRLHKLPTPVIDKLARAALEVSGMAPDSVQEAKKN